MQQYTRLVLLAVEVVAALRLRTNTPLQPPSPAVLLPCSYGRAFSASCGVPADMMMMMPDPEPGQEDAGGEGEGGCAPRSLAVRLIICFVGAVLGWPFSMRKFVEGVRTAYLQVG